MCQIEEEVENTRSLERKKNKSGIKKQEAWNQETTNKMI
jgi:hypothetical protein